MVPTLIGTAALVCTLFTGCGSGTTGTADRHSESLTRTTSGASARAAAPSPSTCAGGWSCTQSRNFGAAKRYIDRQAAQNGYLSVVFTDRHTGKTWRYGPTDHPGWTASTIKLAMATDILERQRSGADRLNDADHHDMATMLNFSDNDASNRLWERFGGADQLDRFRQRFGMTDLTFIPGFTNGPYWGFVKCTSEDLSHLMNYVLTRTDPQDREYLVKAMRGVASNQQWGVWAAGHDEQPGNKDGWSYEKDAYGKHWVLDSVGFAGPDERFTVGIMFQVAPGGSISYGAHTVSDVVAELFGAAVPADITVPTPDD